MEQYSIEVWARSLSYWCLNQVVVSQLSNVEYCYCVVDSDPNMTGIVTIAPQTADYHFNRKVYVGTTKLSEYQLYNVIKQFQGKYTCGEYHIFSNNCNHFSSELIKKVTGQDLPNQLFRATNCLKYMCCCLPKGFVSGQWQLQKMRKQEQENRDLI